MWLFWRWYKWIYLSFACIFCLHVHWVIASHWNSGQQYRIKHLIFIQSNISCFATLWNQQFSSAVSPSLLAQHNCSVSAALPSPTSKLSKKSTSAGPTNLILFLLSRLASAVFPPPCNRHRLRLRPGWGQHNFLKMLSQLFSDINVLSNRIYFL